jgi:hypothetical protein
MDAEVFAAMAAELESSLKPYKEGYEKFDQLPDEGLDREEILNSSRPPDGRMDMFPEQSIMGMKSISIL